MAFIRPSRHAFTSEQSAAVQIIAKAFLPTAKNTLIRVADSSETFRTRPCAFGPNCNRGDSCTYANDSMKLIPMRCKFDDKCYNKESCRRFHTGQTMDEYITINRFTWPEKKVTVEESDEKSDDSFVIQIDEKGLESDADLIESEITEVCAEIEEELHKKETFDDLESENYRLNRTEYDEEFDNFVDYCETVYVYQKTLQNLHDESQYAEFVRRSMP